MTPPQPNGFTDLSGGLNEVDLRGVLAAEGGLDEALLH
jgi:hypothetical protein